MGNKIKTKHVLKLAQGTKSYPMSITNQMTYVEQFLSLRKYCYDVI